MKCSGGTCRSVALFLALGPAGGLTPKESFNPFVFQFPSAVEEGYSPALCYSHASMGRAPSGSKAGQASCWPPTPVPWTTGQLQLQWQPAQDLYQHPIHGISTYFYCCHDCSWLTEIPESPRLQKVIQTFNVTTKLLRYCVPRWRAQKWSITNTSTTHAPSIHREAGATLDRSLGPDTTSAHTFPEKPSANPSLPPLSTQATSVAQKWLWVVLLNSNSESALGEAKDALPRPRALDPLPM